MSGGCVLSDYTKFIANVKQKTGIDLSLYKEAQMKRRLTSLYEKRGCESFTEYFELIRNDPSRMDEFLDRMTINVSEFYRNFQRWEILDRKIIPQLLGQSKKLKCWSAACSTGEEPYSMAMVLANHIPLRDLTISATDLDASVLEKAKVGLYAERSLKEVPLPIKQKYFTQEGQFFQVKDDVKRTVIFKQHNLLEDPYGQGFNLIVCRNVMIYFTEEAKHQIYTNFAKALEPGGILFVGSTEQIFSPEKYGLVSEDTFFYKKI